MFKEALEKALCLSPIENGFRKTGLYYYNQDAMDKSCLIPTLPQEQLSSQKTTSTVSTPTNATLANITPQDPTKISKANNISTTTPVNFG